MSALAKHQRFCNAVKADIGGGGIDCTCVPTVERRHTKSTCPGGWLSFVHEEGDSRLYVCCCGWWAAWSGVVNPHARSIGRHERGCDERFKRTSK